MTSYSVSVLPRFPANVATTGPITLTQSGVSYTFGFDIGLLTEGLSPAAASFAVVKDSVTGAMQKVKISNLFSASVPGIVGTAALADKAVTFAKIQDVASGVLLGRATAGTGTIGTITLGSGFSLTGGVLNLTGTSITAVAAGTGINVSTVSGTATVSIPTSGITTGLVADKNVTYGKIADFSGPGKLLGRSTTGAGSPEEISVGAGLSVTGGTLTATTPFVARYTSPQQTITSSGGLTLAHGLAQAPTEVSLAIVCQTAEAGYSIGDYVPLHQINPASPGSGGVVVVPDATNLTVRFGTSAAVFFLKNKTTGADTSATNANWKAVFKAWY